MILSSRAVGSSMAVVLFVRPVSYLCIYLFFSGANFALLVS